MKTNPAAQHAATLQTKIPPAREAREAIESQPNLADQPFGKLVSQYARGTTESSSTA